MTEEHKAIVTTERSEQPTAIEREAASILEVISRAAKDPTVDVAKLERLLAIQERLLTDQRRQSYVAALARLQAKLPQIGKAGVITDRDGVLRNRYAKIEDVDVVIRPMLAEEGFSFSFDSRQGDKGIEFTGALHHRDGHTETKTLTLPVDTGPGRNAVQSIGSTTSYARRYLLMMHLNIVTRDEDDDGAGGRGPVTAEQAAELRTKLADVGGSEEKFLKWAGAATFEEIPATRYNAALAFLAEKKRRAT